MFVAGMPSLVVAVIGVGGVLFTQVRADARERALANAARDHADLTQASSLVREASIEFMSALWSTTRLAREVLNDDADAGHLNADEMEPLTRAYSALQILAGAELRKAADGAMDAFFAWVEAFDEGAWENLDHATDLVVDATRSQLEASLR
ncbi:hypothetical protein [Prescottella equi]|uniref:hypothetical protein n=1 Tax=Rhodococcus hoagii TaxID=43767 RepID=UPI000A9917F9|nr:hypothetical protein [Prescottella equi]